MSRRAFVVVLDACGVGATSDAAEYGDEGSDTLGHLAAIEGGLALPTLAALGLGHLTAIAGVPPSGAPVVHGRLAPIGPGKDSIVGHWGLMGVAAPGPLPAWPEGVAADEREEWGQALGVRFLAGARTDGITAIERWGEQHLASGDPILYTSVDSVLQVAAHDDHWPAPALHELCARLHAALTPERRPARVIARPFAGRPGAFRRTDGRRDVALPPPGRSYLDELLAAGQAVHGVGKVVDVFAGRGFTATHPGATNAVALATVERLLDELPAGLAFANLVETDERYGHRKDTAGFHRALREIDAAVARWLPRLGADDLLILTADHGVDPAAPHRDHTRELAPLLATVGGTRGGPVVEGARHDGVLADVGATVLRWLTGGDAPGLPGRPLLG
ncbi:phosphopentomutase [Patulibacter defluvii]|uniref:phosphopentomutase n=1 Tax=Patulibacter defluvii TaxID=3095358 RepID=UPI002A765A31|nr:phosphopentomutase [Patulibacter sp. DM4]